MADHETLIYERDGRIGRITLDRPERGNGITLRMPVELAAAVEEANLDPGVHVIALAGNGSGFCGGYDLVDSAEGMGAAEGSPALDGAPTAPAVVAANHDPGATWDPVVDFQMMSRNLRGFMSLFHSDKPVVVKIHGFCVAGGTDMALCSDLIVAEDRAKIGYPPARVWGVPTSMLWAHRVGLERAKRLLLTGDSIDGTTAVEWGLASECWRRWPKLDAPLRWRCSSGWHGCRSTNSGHAQARAQPGALRAGPAGHLQTMSVFFDGIARHTPEGYDFQRRAAEAGFREAVRERDEPFGDLGLR